MATFVDDFNRADAGSLGSDWDQWTANVTELEIKSNEARGGNATQRAIVAASAGGGGGIADASVLFKFYYDAQIERHWFALLRDNGAAFFSGNEGYLLGVANRGGNGLDANVPVIGHRSDLDDVTEIASGSLFTFTDLAHYWIRAEVEGTTLRFRMWKDGDAEPGTWLVSGTDSTLAAGGVGFYTEGSGNRYTQFDDFAFDVLNSGIIDGAAAFDGTGSLSVGGEVPGVHDGAVVFSGHGLLTVTGTGNVYPLVILGGSQAYAVDFGSLSISERLAERSTASLVVWDLNGNLPAIDEGMPITVKDPEARIVFDGFVAVPQQSRPNTLDTPIRWRIDAADFHYLADRRLVADAWSASFLGDIVGDIITNVLADEGITAGTIATGPLLAEVVLAYVTAAKALDRLTTATGHTWMIDSGKKLHVMLPTGTATGTIDAGDVKESPDLRRTSPDYRNRQTVRGAQGFTDSQVEEFFGDGKQTTFTVGYSIGQVPTVKVNAVAKTVGIRGIDTGKDWYWNKGDPKITQDTGGTKLGGLDLLEVTYVGLFPMVIISNDPAEQTRRATVEGSGTGQVEAVTKVAEVYGASAALQIATGLLGTYSKEGRSLTIVTSDPSYHAGQYVTVDLPELGENGEAFLVSAVQTRDLTRSEWDYTVTAIQGADAGSWQARLARGLETPDLELSIRENISETETLLVLHQIAESWGWSESVTQTVWQCPVPSTTLYPETTLYPC